MIQLTAKLPEDLFTLIQAGAVQWTFYLYHADLASRLAWMPGEHRVGGPPAVCEQPGV